MNPESPFRSVVSPTPKLSERRYALRLVVVPCRYCTSPSPVSQPFSPSLSNHISSVVVPHLLRRRIHSCCPAYPPLLLSLDVFTTDLVCLPHYPSSPPRLHCHPQASLLRFSLHYISSSRVLRWRCLSTFSDRIFSSLCVILYYTAWSALSHTNFITLCTGLLTTLFFSILERLFSLSLRDVLVLLQSTAFLIQLPSLRSASIWSFPLYLSAPICLLHIWSAQLWLLRSCFDLLAPIFLNQLT